MPEIERVVLTGRFQPVHLGHVEALKKLLEIHPKVIIVIGTRNFRNFQHPFSGYERKRFWEAAINDVGIPANRVKIQLLRKTRLATNLRTYTHFIISRIGKNAVYYTGNQRMKEEYLRAGVKTMDIPTHHARAATDVRLRIVRGEKWTQLVTPGVARLLMEGGLTERLQKIAKHEGIA